MKAVLPAVARPLLEPHLALVADTIRAAGPALRWVSTLYAGLDAFPLDWLRARDVTVTNGRGWPSSTG